MNVLKFLLQINKQCTTLYDHQLMHRGTQCNTPLPIVAQAIWDGQAILATDGSVKNEIMTYAWIISTTNKNIEQDITSSSLLPPSTPYTCHASKQLEAAALYAALKWITHILQQYPILPLHSNC